MRVQRALEGLVLDRSGEPCYRRPRQRRKKSPRECDHCQVKFRSGQIIARRKRGRQQKMHEIGKNFSWLCQRVKAIDNRDDGSKTGWFYEALAVLNILMSATKAH
jgi:hypothetical protein